MTFVKATFIVVLAGSVSAEEATIANCPELYSDPVVSLDTPSRYEEESVNRSALDADADDRADAVLAPVDNFIRAIVSDANALASGDADAEIRGNCALSALRKWAQVDALSDLETETARLTIGSRLAGLAMAMRQMQPHLASDPRWQDATHWLERRIAEDAAFWSSDAAPRRAASNNLRGWSALALVAGGDLLGRDDFLGYGAALTERLICSALDDGAYPLEMLRGRFALHYHLHMLSALAPAAAIIETKDHVPAVSHACRDALAVSVTYAIDEIQNGGQATEDRTGQAQSLFEGEADIRPDQLAWLAAYLTTHDDARAAKLMDSLPWIANSKLGGNQRLIW